MGTYMVTRPVLLPMNSAMYAKQVDSSITNLSAVSTDKNNKAITDGLRATLNDLKNKKFRDYDSSDFIMITVTLSEDNYNKLNTNYKNY